MAGRNWLALVPAARVDPGDDVQTNRLFDQVRETIPKLRRGMSLNDVERILKTDKLIEIIPPASVPGSRREFQFPDKSKRVLKIWHLWRHLRVVDSVIHFDGDRVIAEFYTNRR